MDYDWPGNVRELENVIERGVVLCTTGPMIGRELVPDQVRSSPGFFHIPPVSVPPEGINLREVIAELRAAASSSPPSRRRAACRRTRRGCSASSRRRSTR